MITAIKERLNLFIAKSPKKAVLLAIIFFNIVFIMISAAIISVMSQYYDGLTTCSFWEAIYYTVAMIFDAGCISFIIKDVKQAGAVGAIVCMAVILIGMVFFTGAVIGYISNIISDFIDSKKNGRNALNLSGHLVIINWNPIALEILCHFLYEEKAIKIIIFVPEHGEEIDEEIRERFNMILTKEWTRVYEEAKDMSFFKKRVYYRKNLLEEKMLYIIREGDTASVIDLDNICISKAKNVLIMEDKFDQEEREGNTQIIKTLVQVSEISKGNGQQNIVIEANDDWTYDQINRIIAIKGQEEEERIFPVSNRKLFGNIYAQIAVFPKLTGIYQQSISAAMPGFLALDLFSKHTGENELEYIRQYNEEYFRSLPLTIMDTGKGRKMSLRTEIQPDVEEKTEEIALRSRSNNTETLDFSKRNILILGHNKNMPSLMASLNAFRERLYSSEDLNIIVIDDADSLKGQNNYQDYSCVKTIGTDIYDYETIDHQLRELSKKDGEETTVFILSDDLADGDHLDGDAMNYLIYVQELIHRMEMEDPAFNREKIQVITEILNPNNEDIVRKYGSDQVMVVPRFLSIISQLNLMDEGLLTSASQKNLQAIVGQKGIIK